VEASDSKHAWWYVAARGSLTPGSHHKLPGTGRLFIESCRVFRGKHDFRGTKTVWIVSKFGKIEGYTLMNVCM
jgi:hypothetical protein